MDKDRDTHKDRAMEKQTERWTGTNCLSETRNVSERVMESVSVIEIEREREMGADGERVRKSKTGREGCKEIYRDREKG